MILCQADEDRLTAPALCKKKLSRRQAGMHGDSMGALKVVDRQTKGFIKIVAILNVFLDLQRDDLGVGGDLFGDLSSRAFQFLFEFLKIINIPI